MVYFDPKEQTQTVLYVDASSFGLGSVLMQNGKVIAYASRALTDVEKRYSQTEKEALSIYGHANISDCTYSLFHAHY